MLENVFLAPRLRPKSNDTASTFLINRPNYNKNFDPSCTAKYDPVPVLKKETSVTCFKSKVTRLEKQKQIETPGPGSYDPDPEVR